MTTPEPPEGPVPTVDPVDELASALIDGEATDAERARAGEPDVAARVAAFEAVARAVAAPIPLVAAADRERAVASALAAVRSKAEVVPLRRARPAVARWLPAAAAVVLVALAAVGLASLDAGDNEDQASGDASSDATIAAAEPSEESGTAADADASSGAGGDAGGGSAAPSAAARAVADLGQVSAAELPERLRIQLGATGDGDEGDDAAVQDAVGVPCAEVFGASLVAVTTAVVDGQPTTIGVFREPDGRESYVALAQADCDTVLASGDL